MTPLNQIKALIQEKDICVLATDGDGKPYCSLMAYAHDESFEYIYMVTHKNTQKYKNLMKNPAVSLMIDSREKIPRDNAQALTVDGTFQKVEDHTKRAYIRQKLLNAHPHLADFIHHPNAEILSVKVNAFILLNGFSEAHYHKL